MEEVQGARVDTAACDGLLGTNLFRNLQNRMTEGEEEGGHRSPSRGVVDTVRRHGNLCRRRNAWEACRLCTRKSEAGVVEANDRLLHRMICDATLEAGVGRRSGGEAAVGHWKEAEKEANEPEAAPNLSNLSSYHAVAANLANLSRIL